ncbi:hypothetical protein Mgra_00006272 [Meloidogyne graminicola]|uniref:Uncharacterized protein n=1 Tax=Meloidogyne graminicola TaxID=189291 RepID=A0A8S9ZMJ7_9BILA|nr:hypothetical protein Mgra_00006272 [Meloidogyne graminicola]
MNAVVYGYLNVEGNNNNNNEVKISKEAYEIIKNNNKRIEEEKITKIKLINESKNSLIEKRNLYLGSKCQTFYTSDPFIVSRAFMQYIYDEQGNRFIDCISNVQHVGHCHPLIVQSIATQSSLSTCNIRFVCPLLGECSKLLINTLSSSNFDTIFYCNSGSEANDLALQLVKDWTKANDVIVLENAYHGHITSTAQLSPYKSEHGANIKKPDWVHIAPVPDVYRGKYKLIDSELNSSEALFRIGELYSKDVCNLIEEINKKGKKVAAFFAEALQSCGGQIIPPSGYFQSVAKAIHNNGGLLVIDEIQTGFGRVGETFWAHQLYKNEKEEFIPDIITMGKSMGNGYPVAAVVTRKEIADKLCGNVEYFNTYGGNPVACAATLSVLQIIEKDNLLKHSKEMGILFKQKLELLKSKHLCIGDIRGIGMFWGLDLVKCRKTREPATNLASKLILKLRKEYGILLNADGPFTNILKFKPPLCFNSDNLENVIKSLDECLNELNNENN